MHLSLPLETADPSIVGASNSKLRLSLDVPHLKRQTAKFA